MIDYYTNRSQLNMMYLAFWVGVPTLFLEKYEFSLLALGVGGFLLVTECIDKIKRFEQKNKVKTALFLLGNALAGVLVFYNLLLYVLVSVILFSFWLSFIAPLAGQD